MTNVFLSLNSLVVYRNILKDELLVDLLAAASGSLELEEEYFDVVHRCIDKAERLNLSGNFIKSYLIYLLAQDNNVFSIAAEQGGIIGAGLRRAVVHDLAALAEFMAADIKLPRQMAILDDYQPTVVAQSEGLAEFIQIMTDRLSFTNVQDMIDRLIGHYRRYGYGAVLDYAVFRWDSAAGLVGVKYSDPVRLDEIVGYDRQKEMLVYNTKAFLDGKPANNVLLVGARGTGKSSSVKALVNQYRGQGLRLVEVSKYDIKSLPQIMDILRGYGKKFIVFLDDLSFEEFEVEYKCLKSVIDGGVEAKPDNVLIYATSNRRHLIRESFSDRSDDGQDVHRFDTVNEKISLSDRFGLVIHYLPPNQEEYFKMVEEIARRSNLSLPAAKLKAEALKWEMSHSGRSGRLAKQFVQYMAGAGR